jgi:anti-sigma-K factor RskA
LKNCEQFKESVEAYALGALDAEERAAFEAHLATDCADCTKDVEEARWLVSQLAYLAPEAEPSDMLKGRLMQVVRAEAQSSKQAAQAKQIVAAKRTVPVWLWAGAAAMLLFSVYSAWDAQQKSNQVREASQQAAQLLEEQQELENQLALAKRETTILTDPTSVKITLASQDKQTPQLEAHWHTELGIVVSGWQIPAPGSNRVLQLWLIPKAAGGKPMPSLTLRPDADGRFVLLVPNPPELMAETKALAITEEPVGGSLQPTTAPRWVGGVS